MSATIELGGEQYTIDEYVWSGPTKGIVDMLNSSLDTEGPSGSDPNPDATAARDIVDKLEVKMIRFDELEFTPGRIY